jgi:amidase
MTTPRRKLAGHLRAPTAADVLTCAEAEHVQLSDDEAQAMAEFVGETFAMLDTVEELPPLELDRKFPTRDIGRAPADENENPYNAFIRLCRIEGAADGVLKGKTLAIKDNLAIAGIPISNSSRTAAYTPDVDAVVIERILEAGGTIVGKLNLDNLSAGAFGESSHYGPPLNPRNPAYSAGGSSGGAAAAVVSGAVDMALGVDEGGSARVPAAFCGCVAVKGSQGLVPSFGLSYFDHTLDFICPVTRTVNDAALLLEVIAGHDWRDPQWVRESITVAPYRQAADSGVRGLRVGVLEETLDPLRCQPAVLEGVERACSALGEAGADVVSVSVPRVRHTSAIWFGAFLGGAAAMIRSDGLGYNHLGYVEVDRVHLAGLSRRLEATSFGVFVQALLIANRYLIEQYGHTFFAKAHNQRLALRREIDQALIDVDVLLGPTAPTTAPELPTGRLTIVEQLERLPAAGVHFPFTQLYNATGHPALVLPTGTDEHGLPTSVQIASRRFAEFDAFRAGFAIEAAGVSTFDSSHLGTAVAEPAAS